VKAQRYDSVKLLLEHPMNPANPTIEADWEGTTPLEEAMNLKDHDMVEVLLRALPKNYESESLLVWIPNNIRTTCQRDLVTHLLEGGHCVLLTSKDRRECAALEESLVQPLRESTENNRVWAILESDLDDFFRGNEKDSSDEKWRPWGVDVWLQTGTADEENPIEAMESVFGPKPTISIPFRGVPKIFYLMGSGDFSGHSQLAHLLRHKSNNQGHLVSSALAEPSTWWNRLTYSLHYRQTWLEAAIGLLVSISKKRDGKNHQNAIDAHGRPLVVPSEERVEAWERRIDGCFPKPSSSSKI